MKTQEEILAIAESLGFDRVSITHGTNGYPKQMGDYGITGFDTFEQLTKFAEEHELRVVCLHQKFGWSLWEIKGDIYCPFDNSDYLDKLGYNYSEFDKDSFVEDVETGLNRLIEKFYGDFSEIEKYIAKQKELIEQVEKASEDEVVILCGSEYHETIKKSFLGYEHDSNRYVISVLVERDRD